MSEFSLKEIKSLPKRERLEVGYYETAKRHVEALKKVT
jgi:hypothetical protein